MPEQALLTGSSLFPLNVILVGDCQSVRPTLFRQAICVENEYATPATALNLFKPSDDVRLFVVEVSSAAEIGAFKRLTEAFPGQLFLALVPETADRKFLFEVMRAGARQVVATPPEAEDLQAVLDWFSNQFGYEASKSQVIAVAGVTGGAGTTSIALNLAYEIHVRHQMNVLLTELTSSVGSLATYLDFKPRHTTRALFNLPNAVDLQQMREALTTVEEGFQVLPADNESIEPLDITPDKAHRLLTCCRRLSQMVVVDVPSEFDDVFFGTLGSAHHIVLVCNQSLASVRTVKMVHEALLRMDGVPRPVVLINRFDSRNKAFSRSTLLRCLPGLDLVSVAYDPAIMQATDTGMPLRKSNPHAPALKDLDELADSLNRQSVPAANKSLVSRALHALGLS